MKRVDWTPRVKPPQPEEQLRMEAFYDMRLGLRGEKVAWGRDKRGNYLSMYANDAWAAWQAAQVGFRVPQTASEGGDVS